MKFFGSTVSLALAVLSSMMLLGESAAAMGPNDAFPQVFTVVTSRETASRLAPQWDIQHSGSRRLFTNTGSVKVEEEEKDFSSVDADVDRDADVNLEDLPLDKDLDLVQLSVVLHSELEVVQLEHLESAGVLSYEAQPEQEQRMLQADQGINQELSCYLTVTETYEALDELKELYPDFVTIETIGESWWKTQGEESGNDIKIIVITAPTDFSPKPDMMVVAGHHSRELPPPQAVMQWATDLLGSYGTDADITWILNRTNIHIVPVANPDGRVIVQENLDWMYRKNAHGYGCPNGTQYDGVDLNRQYPWMWGLDSGSSGDPCSLGFRGPAALSEPESSAVYNYANQLFSADIKRGSNAEEAETNIDMACSEDASGIFMDVHSYGDFVYFPFGFNDTLSPNHRSLLTMSAKLAHPGNYSLWGPGQDGFLYFVSGDATDATYGIDCVASYGYELGTQFYADCFELQADIAPKLAASLLYAAKSVSQPYVIPLGPDIITIDIDMKVPTATEFTVTASDGELIVPHTIYEEGNLTSAVASVQFWVDEHPYDSDSDSGTMMDPVDGAFDDEDEVAVYTMDVTDWGDGEHIVYFQATDSEGYAGPVSAVFVTVGEGGTSGSSGGSDGGDSSTSSANRAIPLVTGGTAVILGVILSLCM